jgi:hypothetical protein
LVESYFAEEEVFDLVKKLSEEESLKLIEPAMEQEKEVTDVEDKEESTTAEDTDVYNDRARPQAAKKLLFALRNLHFIYNPIIDKIANSEQAEFYFYQPGIKWRNLKPQ